MAMYCSPLGTGRFYLLLCFFFFYLCDSLVTRLLIQICRPYMLLYERAIIYWAKRVVEEEPRISAEERATALLVSCLFI